MEEQLLQNSETIFNNTEKTLFLKVPFKNNLIHGETVAQNESGVVIQKANYVNGKLDGNLTLYNNGNVKTKIPFKNNQPEGTAEYYNDNGKLIGTESYKNGKKEGPSEWYFPNGKKNFTENYSGGKLHGERLEYSASGKIKKRTYFENGILVEQAERPLKKFLAKQKMFQVLTKIFGIQL